MNEIVPKEYDATKERRKSLVRVVVTYGAAGFLFVGSVADLVLYLYWGQFECKQHFQCNSSSGCSYYSLLVCRTIQQQQIDPCIVLTLQ